MDEAKSDVAGDSRIKLRLENVTLPPDHIPSTDFDVSCWRDTELNVTVKDLLLEIQAQTIKCVTEFLEDLKTEDNVKPIVFEILVDNVQLLFKDSPSDNVEVEPTRMIFKKLKVARENNGPMSVEPYTVGRTRDLSYEMNVDKIQTMSAEIELLRKRLTAMNYLKEENSALRQYQEETKLLRSCLMAAQNQIAQLLEERRKVMEHMSGVSSSHISESGGGCKR